MKASMIYHDGRTVGSMTTEGDEGVTDVAQLRREFPAWDFGVQWIAANSRSDARQLLGWSLEHGGPPLCALDAEGMRRAIREAGG